MKLKNKVAIITGSSRGTGKATVLFLAFSEARYITGEMLVVDGGYSLR